MSEAAKLTTQEYYKKIAEELPVTAKKSLGQNFLINDVTISKIIQAAKDFQPKHIIEIGPGLGALTRHLLEMNIPIELIELDHVFAAYWKSKNMQLIEQDALQVDWGRWADIQHKVLVSNLPYQISSSIVIDRSIDEAPFSAMVLMFQKEVAQRIRAIRGDSNFGMLSVVAQSFWDIHTVCDAGPRDFNPAPKIASRVLAFSRKPADIQDHKRYLRFVKACFLHPRRTMLGNITSSLSFPKEQTISCFKEQGFDDKIRPHEVSVEQFQKLYRQLFG